MSAFNSYGFNGEWPTGAVAGEYDYNNGEFTGQFYFSATEASAAEMKLPEGRGVEWKEIDLDNLDNDDFVQPGEDRYMPEGDWAAL